MLKQWMIALAVALVGLGVTACTEQKPASEDRVRDKSADDDDDDKGKSGDSKRRPKRGGGDDDDRGSRGSDDDDDDDGDDREGRPGSGGGSDSGGCRDWADAFDTSTNISGEAPVPLLGSINFDVDVDASIELEADGDQASITIDTTIVRASPALARNTAETALNAYGAPMTLTLVPLDEQGEIAGLEDMDCVVLAATEIESDSFHFKYDPALPMLVNPNAKEFSGISGSLDVTAEVIRHYDSANGARPGTYEGTASVRAGGGSVKFEYDFGTGAPDAFSTPFAGLEFAPDGNDEFSSITAEVWLVEGRKVPIVLDRE